MDETASTAARAEEQPAWAFAHGRYRADWATGEITPESPFVLVAIVSGVLALATYGFVTLALGLLRGTILARSGTFAHVLAGAMLVMGFLLCGSILARLTRVGWARLRAAGSVLQLSTTPAVLGSTLEGTVKLGRPVPAAGGFVLKLSCSRRLSDATGGGELTSTTRELWSESHPENADSHASLAVKFRLPADGEPSAQRSTRRDLRTVTWFLQVTSRHAKKYHADFQLPVVAPAQGTE